MARRPEDAPAAYRHGIEDYLKQGLEEGRWDRLTQALAIGSTGFLEKLRRKLTGEAGARTNARAWRRLLPFAAIAQAVEGVRGARWAEVVERRGDWGRDLTLYVGRLHGGLTLKELAIRAGMPLDTVQSCVQRVRRHLAKDAVLRRNHAKVMQALADRLENA